MGIVHGLVDNPAVGHVHAFGDRVVGLHFFLPALVSDTECVGQRGVGQRVGDVCGTAASPGIDEAVIAKKRKLGAPATTTKLPWRLSG